MTTTDALGLADELEATQASLREIEIDLRVSSSERDLIVAALRSSPSAVREEPAVSTGEVVAWRWNTHGDPRWRASIEKPVPRPETDFDKIEPLYASLPAAKAAGDDRTCAENAQVASGDVRAAVIEECVNIALAIDSGRGNEKEIAKAIRALSQAPALRTPHPTQRDEGRGGDAASPLIPLRNLEGDHRARNYKPHREPR